MSGARVLASADSTPAGADVEWTYDPWREHPRVAALAALAALGTCAVVVSLHLTFVLASALCVACIASFAPALAPVGCAFDAGGVTRRGPFGTQRREWSEIRRADPLPAAVRLSPFARAHWLDATRALVLPLPAAERERLLAALAAHRTAHGR